MTVRELMSELALYPPDTIAIVRSDERGFTSDLSVIRMEVVRSEPPIAGIPYRPAQTLAAGGRLEAILIGPPETF